MFTSINRKQGKKYTYQPLEDFKNKAEKEMMVDLEDIVKVFPHKVLIAPAQGKK